MTSAATGKKTGPEKIWKFFASIQLTLILLFTLAGTSIVGTFIPQNAEPAFYFHQYGPTAYRILKFLNIFDMYHSYWFQFLLLMLLANILICSIDRWPAVQKIVFKKNRKLTPEQFTRFHGHAILQSPKKQAELQNLAESILKRKCGRVQVEKNGDIVSLFGETGRWTRLGAYIVHCSIVLLLIGCFIGANFGFDGYANIPEGEATDIIQLTNDEQIRLGFKIRCDDFDVSFYETGQPKEFRSKLTLLSGDKVIHQKDIIVNDPLRFSGINIYQSSYGLVQPESFILAITCQNSGMVYNQEARLEDTITLPEGLGTLYLKDYTHAFEFRGHNIGKSLLAEHTSPEGEKTGIAVPLDFPGFDKMRHGSFSVSVTDYEKRYFTGLQVTKDPGVPVVYTSFILMIIGFYIAFFISHNKYFIKIQPDDDKGSQVYLFGASSKNRIAMHHEIEKWANKFGH